MRTIAITAALIAVAAVVPSQALGHITVRKQGNTWYFDGSTYSQSASPSDPVDMLFFRSSSTSATASTINTAFAQHWTGPGTMSSTAKCTAFSGDQFMRFRAYRRYNGADQTVFPKRDFQELNGAVVSNDSCADEYHVRWWLDGTHASIAQGNDFHGTQGQWVVGGAHHEDRGTFTKHHIDRNWDSVRDTFLRYMRYYCSNRHFKYHAGSYGPYQGFSHDGYIAALSLTPRTSGC